MGLFLDSWRTWACPNRNFPGVPNGKDSLQRLLSLLLHSASALRDAHHISLGPEEYVHSLLNLLLIAGVLTFTLAKLSFLPHA